MKKALYIIIFLPFTIVGQEWVQLHDSPCQNLVVDNNDIYYSINNGLKST